MARSLAALLVATALVVGGCGSDSKSTKSARKSPAAPAAVKAPRQSPIAAATLAPAPPAGRRPAHTGAAPQPVEPLGDALAAFKQAAAEGSCQKLLPLRDSAERGGAPVGSQPSPQECAAFESNGLSLVKGLVPTGSEQFGTAAVVDYTRNGEDTTGLWLLEADGRWRYLISPGYLAHSVGSRPANPSEFDAPVAGFVAAAQRHDCAAAFRFLDATSPYAAGQTQQQFCDFVRPLFGQRYNFFQQAAANPRAKPRLLGKTRLFGLYSIDFGATYWILVGKITPGGTPDAQKQGHVPDGFQAMYSGSFAPS
jgi:hypothetical protein